MYMLTTKACLLIIQPSIFLSQLNHSYVFNKHLLAGLIHLSVHGCIVLYLLRNLIMEQFEYLKHIFGSVKKKSRYRDSY